MKDERDGKMKLESDTSAQQGRAEFLIHEGHEAA
jgi:hypothetical protein